MLQNQKSACKVKDHTFQGWHTYISGLLYNSTGILFLILCKHIYKTVTAVL